MSSAYLCKYAAVVRGLWLTSVIGLICGHLHLDDNQKIREVGRGEGEVEAGLPSSTGVIIKEYDTLPGQRLDETEQATLHTTARKYALIYIITQLNISSSPPLPPHLILPSCAYLVLQGHFVLIRDHEALRFSRTDALVSYVIE